jgi:hypothetical protein
VVDPARAEVTHAGWGFIEVLRPASPGDRPGHPLERYGVGFVTCLVFGDMPKRPPHDGGGARRRRPGGRGGQSAPPPSGRPHHCHQRHDVDGVGRYLEALLDGRRPGV